MDYRPGLSPGEVRYRAACAANDISTPNPSAIDTFSSILRICSDNLLSSNGHKIVHFGRSTEASY